VHKIAEVVHTIDIEGALDKVPSEAKGIKALLTGLRFMTADDYETPDIRMKVWKAFYTYFKF